MKINTDLVKNKKFSSAILPSLLNHSQEYRVLATLRYLYPAKFEHVIAVQESDDYSSFIKYDEKNQTNSNSNNIRHYYNSIYICGDKYINMWRSI